MAILQRMFGPIAPGLPGSVNPLTFIGAGLASGNMGAAMTQMAAIQQQAQQQQAQQHYQNLLVQKAQAEMQERQRQAQEREALKAQAPDIVAGLMSSDPDKQKAAAVTMAGISPQVPETMLAAHLKAGAASGGMKEFMQYMSLPPDMRSEYLRLQAAGSMFGGLGQFQAAPLSQDASKWTNPEGESPRPDMTAQQATAAGFTPITEAQQKRQEGLSSLNAMQDSLNRYRDLLTQTGPEAVGSNVNLLRPAYTDLMMQAKEMYNLGALTGPDLQLMQNTLTDPTGLEAQWLEKTGRSKALLDQLDQVQQRLNDAKARVQGREPERRTTLPQVMNDADYDALPPGTRFLDPNGEPRQKPYGE